MDSIVQLYTKEILAGNKTIDEVPAKLKDLVQAEIDKESVGE